MGSILASGASRRSYLFLQGPIGWFFSRLARRLLADGHEIHRINMHGGDQVFWRLPGAVNYRGNAAEWPAFLDQLLKEWQITDLLLFGDCRPMHRAALHAAAANGVVAHVFEEGYLRPNWITLERGGVNANSSLPRDPQYYWHMAATELPAAELPIAYSFVRRALEHALYHTAMVVMRAYFRGYRTHRPWHPYVEFAHVAGRYLRKPRGWQRAVRFAERLDERSQPYFLFPLQLDSDTQIRHHSAFRRMQPAIERVVRSFAQHAPADALLVVTEHPLETGVVNLKPVVRQCALAAGVAKRLIYLEGGTPSKLLRLCRGVVTVNSTIGFQSLSCGVPVIALGDALYALPGLTFQDSLDEFWRRATPANPLLFEAFRRVISARTQINGGFYSASGIAMAVDNAASRLELNLEAHQGSAGAEVLAVPLQPRSTSAYQEGARYYG